MRKKSKSRQSKILHVFIATTHIAQSGSTVPDCPTWQAPHRYDGLHQRAKPLLHSQASLLPQPDYKNPTASIISKE